MNEPVCIGLDPTWPRGLRLRGGRDQCVQTQHRRLAICDREEDTAERLVHYSDRAVQDLSSRYTERLAAAGIEPSAGSGGDAVRR